MTMPLYNLVAAAVATTILGVSSVAHAQVTFGSASLSDSAYAIAYDGLSKSQTSTGNDSGSANSLPTASLYAEADASASAVKMGLGSTANAYETATAIFAGASAGSIEFAGNTSATVTGTNSSAYGEAYNNSDYFQYTFDVTNPENMTISYSDTDTSPYYEYNEYYALYNVDGTVSASDYNLNNSSGSQTYALTAGSYYFYAEDNITVTSSISPGRDRRPGITMINMLSPSLPPPLNPPPGPC
jgi:hypothetical protein